MLKFLQRLQERCIFRPAIRMEKEDPVLTFIFGGLQNDAAHRAHSDPPTNPLQLSNSSECQSQIAKLQQSRLVLQVYSRRQLVTEGPPTHGKSRSRTIAWDAARTISTRGFIVSPLTVV